MALTALGDTVDLTRYPIDDRGGPTGRALVSHCRAELAALGSCDLPGFLRPDAVKRIVNGLTETRAIAYRTDTMHNIEFSEREAELEPDDPLRIQVRSAKWLVAYDQIPESSPIREVYESDDVTRFVGAALGVDPIYRQTDEIGALNVMFYDAGDELGWHFDNADFAVTLMLQAPTSGGEFEHVPMLRTSDNLNPDGVAGLLNGDRARVRTLNPKPGTLALFRGHLSAHRVTPVRGSKPRINAVLCYAEVPDARLTTSARRIFYGRVTD